MGDYWKLVSAVMRSQMRYRVSFVVDLVTVGAANALGFLAFALAFTGFGCIGGWSLWQVAFLWGLSEAAFGAMDMIFSGFDPSRFSQHVKRGTFDQFLLRPVNLVTQIFASDFALRRLGRVSQGLAIFLFANIGAGVVWTPEKLAYLPLVFVAAVAFYGSLFVFGATLCFWTTESLEIVNVFTYGGTTMASYPMHIYNDVVRRLFTFVIPTALMIYYPALFFFDLPDPTGLPKLAQFLAPLVGFGMLVMALFAWRFGVRRYQGTGS
jgi:ABC-2 type transport system permease protein